MVVLNAIGLSNDTSVPPGSPRDGYLGLPGVLIGGGLVVTGGVLLDRARATRVVYRRSERWRCPTEGEALTVGRRESQQRGRRCRSNAP
jgi:hypothetical protein